MSAFAESLESLPIASSVTLATQETLTWCDWDDGCSVFNRATGETHFFDLWTSYLLRLIGSKPMSVESLVIKMARELDQEHNAALQARVAKTLQNFEAMALVELCPGV